jgi:hypothetical protein
MPPGAFTILSLIFLTLYLAEPASASILLGRQSTTCSADASLSVCNNGLPSSWCCPQGTSCLKLNNTITDVVICCPNTSTNQCQNIQPISCDISLQDPNLYPKAAVHVGNTSLTLPQCGTSGSCCPIGYDCLVTTAGNSICQIKASSTSPQSSAAPAATSATTSGTTSATMSATKSGSVVSTIRPSAAGAATPFQTPAVASSDGPSPPARGAWIAVGVIVGLIALAILFFGLLFIRRKRKEKAEAQSYAGGIGGIPISEPIYNPQLAARTDFLNMYRADQVRRSSEDSVSGEVYKDGEKSITRPGTADSNESSAALVRDSIQVRQGGLRKKKSQRSLKKSKSQLKKRESSPTRMVMIRMDTTPDQSPDPNSLTTPSTSTTLQTSPPPYQRQPGGILKNVQQKPEVYIPTRGFPTGVTAVRNLTAPRPPVSHLSQASSLNTLAVVVDGNGSPSRTGPQRPYFGERYAYP